METEGEGEGEGEGGGRGGEMMMFTGLCGGALSRMCAHTQQQPTDGQAEGRADGNERQTVTRQGRADGGRRRHRLEDA